MLFKYHIITLLLIIVSDYFGQQPDIDDVLIYKTNVTTHARIRYQAGWFMPDSALLNLFDISRLKGKNPFLVSEIFFDPSGHFDRQIHYDLYGFVTEYMNYNKSGKLAEKTIYKANDLKNKVGYFYSIMYNDTTGKLFAYKMFSFDSTAKPAKYSLIEMGRFKYNAYNLIDSLVLIPLENNIKTKRVFLYKYDDSHRLSKVDEPFNTNYETIFIYDSKGRLKESIGSCDPILCPIRKKKYSYTPFDLPEKVELISEGKIKYEYTFYN